MALVHPQMPDHGGGVELEGHVVPRWWGSLECYAKELRLPLGHGVPPEGLRGVKLFSLLFGPIAIVW